MAQIFLITSGRDMDSAPMNLANFGLSFIGLAGSFGTLDDVPFVFLMAFLDGAFFLTSSSSESSSSILSSSSSSSSSSDFFRFPLMSFFFLGLTSSSSSLSSSLIIEKQNVKKTLNFESLFVHVLQGYLHQSLHQIRFRNPRLSSLVVSWAISLDPNHHSRRFLRPESR